MSIRDRKLEFIAQFLKIENSDSLNEFENLLNEHISKVEPISKEELNNRIDISEKNFEENKFIAQKEMIEKYKK